MRTVFLQVADVAESTASDVQTKVSENLFDAILDSWYIMIPLLFFSVYSVYVFVERFITIKKASEGDKNFMNKVLNEIQSGNIPAARNLTLNTDGPVADILESGISRLETGKSMKAIREAVETQSNIEVRKLENGISFLATAAGAAPMIGFLGTTIGMIGSFNAMRNSTGGIKIQEIAPGMMEAMLTTVGGLIVGILAYIGHNYLMSKIDNVVYQMLRSSNEFFDLIDKPGN